MYLGREVRERGVMGNEAREIMFHKWFYALYEVCLSLGKIFVVHKHKQVDMFKGNK